MNNTNSFVLDLKIKRCLLCCSRNFQLQRTKGKTVGRPTISSLKKSDKYHRSAIDLPTAEPYLECTSDCDDYSENRLTSTTNSFRMRIKSGQRPQSSDKSIANDLIVVSSQKTDTIIESQECFTSVTEIKEKFNNVAVSELPAIKGSKRHSAWHNMKKYIPFYTHIFFFSNFVILFN